MAELTLKELEDAIRESKVQVVSIRQGKKGRFVFNFRVTSLTFDKPHDREYATLDEGFRSFFKFKEKPKDELEDLLG
jgi:hypothetical protein